MTFLTRTTRGSDPLGLHGDFQRLFDGFAGLTPAAANGTLWVPPVDVSEDGEAYAFQLDLPGLDAKDIKIEMDGDTLSIRGERKNEMVKKESDLVHRVERMHGSFERKFRLALPVDSGAIKAAYKNGVLDVRVPKLEQAKKREITIDVG
jgi:HSP20 family protein